jgi:RNA polymerase sigma factor FliA
MIDSKILDLTRAAACRLAERTGYRVDSDELFSVGQHTLVVQSHRFDPALGVPFYAFALPRVKGAMLDYLRDLDPNSRRLRTRLKAIREKDPADYTAEDRADLGAAVYNLRIEEQPEGWLDSQTGEKPRNLGLHELDHGVLVKSVMRLNPLHAFVVWQVYIFDKRQAAVAEFLGYTESRVGQIIQEALPKLRRHYSQEEHLAQ